MVMSGYARLSQVRSGWVRLIQVVRLNLVRLLCQVRKCLARVRQVRSR
jgi:hypothetical protein